MGKMIDEVTNYLHDNYYNDCERMAKIKMVSSLATMDGTEKYRKDLGSMIDKVALFNSIEKSYPPKKTIKQEIIRGIGFILYG